jgi:hypothetical protein
VKVKNLVMPPLVVHAGGIVVEEPTVQDNEEKPVEIEQPPSIQAEDEEEKIVAPAGAEESEDTHGGNEATDSIQDSPSVSDDGQEDRDTGESPGEEGDQGKPGSSDGDEGKGEAGAGTDGEAISGQGDEGEDGSGGDAPENADTEQQTGDGTGEAPEIAEADQESEKNDQATKDQANEDEAAEDQESEKNDQAAKDQANEDEAAEDQAAANGKINATEVVKHEYVSIAALKQAFYRLVNDLADQRAGEEPGHDVLSMKRLIRRALDKRSLEKCRVHLIREDIIVILDDSGSMEWWANLLNALATLCVKRKDVRVFWAPNGRINDPRWERQQGRGFVKIEPFPSSVKGMNVIYVGDFDGGDAPYLLAKAGANVAWYCPETRYEDTSEHDWCHHALGDYPKRVQFFWANSLVDLLRAFKKTRKMM